MGVDQLPSSTVRLWTLDNASNDKRPSRHIAALTLHEFVQKYTGSRRIIWSLILHSVILLSLQWNVFPQQLIDRLSFANSFVISYVHVHASRLWFIWKSIYSWIWQILDQHKTILIYDWYMYLVYSKPSLLNLQDHSKSFHVVDTDTRGKP